MWWLFLLMGVIVIFAVAAYFEEKAHYNKGTCIMCGGKLKQFAYSRGVRGYVCEKCNHTVFCSCEVDKEG